MGKSYIDQLLGDQEQILLSTRQHWFVLMSLILLEIVLIVLIVALTLVGMAFNPLLVFGFVLLVVPLFTLVRDFLIWYNRAYIITNRRVIQVSGIYNKNVTDSSLEKVNDVHMTQSIWGRLFGFGDVEILTASEAGVNLFKRIGDPINFKTTMINAKVALEHEVIEPVDRSHDIPYLIGELDKLRQRGLLTEAEFQQKKSALLARL